MAEVRIPQPGEVVAGKYRLLRLIGEGGMGVVMAAEHLRLRQPIAIKFLNPAMIGVAEIVERFEREARAAATLRSRHVVRVTDVEQTAERVPYMVMELLDGADLESERERRGQLPFAEAVDYVLQACGALSEAHDAGIVHRDLKPGNLFLAKEDGDRIIVKVLDFGISKFLKDDNKLTSAGAIMGTALYMSPEQIRGDVSIDARSDVWALGVILYELIGGQAPWLGPPTRVAAAIVSEPVPDLRARCQVPEPLARAIHAMLEKNPAHRPQSVPDVVSAIAPFVAPGTVGAEVAELVMRRSQRNLGALAGGPISSSSPISSRAPQHGAPGTGPAPLDGGAGPASSEGRFPVSTRSNPEHSTMAATTRSAIGSRPRALWGMIAGFCTLAITGIALIVVVARSKAAATDGGASSPGKSSAVVTPEPPAPPPPSSVSATPEPTPSPAATTATVAATGALPHTAPPSTTAPVATAKKPTPSSTHTAPAQSTSRPATKPTATASAAGNNPFLL